MLTQAEIPDDLPRIYLAVDAMPEGWSRYPAPEMLGQVRARFSEQARAAILIVPSARPDRG